MSPPPAMRRLRRRDRVDGGCQRTPVPYPVGTSQPESEHWRPATTGPVSSVEDPIEIGEGLSMYTTGAQPTPVFISSVMTELATERRLLASMIAELGATPVLFEDFGGRDQGAQEAYLAGVARSDIYVGVIGDRYGAITPTGRSATHQEYREAVRLDKRISVWVRDHGANRQGDARDFVDEVRVFHTTGSFTDPEDLVRRVRARLVEIAAEDLAPWVKLGAVVFRAERITDRGSQVRVEATVRDPAVAEALTGFRSD